MDQRKLDIFETFRSKGVREDELKELLKNSPDIEKTITEYKDYLALTEGISNFEENRLKDFLYRESNKTKEINHPKIVHFKSRKAIYLTLIAASICLLLIPTYQLFLFNDHLYTHYNPKEMVNTEMGELMNNRTPDNQPQEEENLITAIQLKQQGKLDGAKRLFETIKQDDLYIRARFHLALIYIKKGNKDKAIQELTKVINSSHYLKAPAQEIQNHLNKPGILFLLKK